MAYWQEHHDNVLCKKGVCEANIQIIYIFKVTTDEPKKNHFASKLDEKLLTFQEANVEIFFQMLLKRSPR